jgi:NADH dehydrogenase/NADH:ubiquinone oxidoreductase subunit G
MRITIDETTVEQTWQDVADMDEDAVAPAMEKLFDAQPELMAFVVELSQDMREEATELAIYLFFVIHEMFSRTSAKPLPIITAQTVAGFWERTVELLESLEEAHDKVIQRIAEVEGEKQPYVTGYLAEALKESAEDEEDIQLTEDEEGQIFMVLKTAIDALDSELNPQE